MWLKLYSYKTNTANAPLLEIALKAEGKQLVFCIIFKEFVSYLFLLGRFDSTKQIWLANSCFVGRPGLKKK